ncbi:glucan biosynthesis protein D [Methylacidiphilum caldifontis]|uniref:Glucan biosynthesis protein D n=1 Tax=Methylacidiphilum caldifontis TaxID=2795386 RepID=A0A4Y8PGU4_9BACT|nr:glucan biosynthesis protein D [Methylacidiphilum caldifontis]TFE72067.1 glucan biosynthesis protein D [Methylacidiphilum caldifontis]
MKKLIVLPSFFLGLLLIFVLSAAFKYKTERKAAETKENSSLFFSKVIKKAKELSYFPYVSLSAVPAVLSNLSYDQWFGISFKDQRGIFPGKSRFVIKPFPLGYLFCQPVFIHLITLRGEEKNYVFEPSLFDYNNLNVENLPKNLGFAGFRVFFDTFEKERLVELFSIVGASYFRSLGLGQAWGLSARALAVNTTGSSKEEFPYYREFWIEEPKEDDQTLSFYALLDGESLTGAFHFIFSPGKTSKVEIENYIFLRKTVEKLGIAPLTSMFLQGENSPVLYNPLHPEEHDSDGLSIQLDTGEWIWGPLQNPPYFSSLEFPIQGKLLGFGLMQRDRNFDHYKSLLLHYESRPSAWIVPGQGWEGGHIELVELPTTTETKDNIVAYYVSDTPALSQKQFHYAYTIFWGREETPSSEIGRVVSTRCAQLDRTIKEYIVDFSIPGFSEGVSPQPILLVGQGAKLLELRVEKNAYVSGFRLTFRIQRQEAGSIPLKAYLEAKDFPLTETWNYIDFP